MDDVKRREEKQAKTRQTMDSLCSVSGLLLSVVCCITLTHVELRIQEHHRLIYHSVTFCDKLERDILRKVEQNYGRRQVMATSRHWQTTKGRCRYMLLMFPVEVTLYVCTVILSWIICQLDPSYCGILQKECVTFPLVKFLVSLTHVQSNKADSMLVDTESNRKGKCLNK